MRFLRGMGRGPTGGIIISIPAKEVAVLSQKVESLEKENLPSRLKAMEDQGLNGRLVTLENQRLNGRLDALEKQGLNDRIKAMEDQNLNERLEFLEGQHFDKKIKMLEPYRNVAEAFEYLIKNHAHWREPKHLDALNKILMKPLKPIMKP
jgi:tRNA A37 N6-isopentenylltransferase MiaA